MENNRLHHFWSLTKLPSVDGEKEKKKQTNQKPERNSKYNLKKWETMNN